MFTITETQKKEVARLMAKGMSMAEAYIKLGIATKVTTVDCNKEKPARKASTSTPREKKIDPVKNWVLNFIAIPLKGCVETPYKVTNLVNDGSKSIDFEIDGESYTLTLTKHKKKA